MAGQLAIKCVIQDLNIVTGNARVVNLVDKLTNLQKQLNMEESEIAQTQEAQDQNMNKIAIHLIATVRKLAKFQFFCTSCKKVYLY